MLSDRCPVCPVCLSVRLTVCDIGVLWPNGWIDQDEIWHRGRPLPRPHCVRWGSSPLPKRGKAPQFSAHVYCGQTARWLKLPLATEVGLGRGHIVLGGDPASPEGRTAVPLLGASSLYTNNQTVQSTKFEINDEWVRKRCHYIFASIPAKC